MRGLSLKSRAMLAWKAITTPFSPEGAQAAQGLLAGILRGSVGPMPARNTIQLLHTFNTSPWIRACAGRVADARATVQWELYVAKNKITGLARSDMEYAQKANRTTRRKILKELRRANELRPIEDHLFLDVMSNNNDYFTGRDVRWLGSIWFDIVGDVFYIKERNAVGATVSLWPVPPHWVSNTPTPTRPFYRMSWGGWQTEIPAADVLWMQNPNPVNPYDRGTGLGMAVDDEVASDEYAAKHQLAFFKNSARPDVLIMPKEGGSFTDPERERFEEFWNQELQGTWKRFKPLFLKNAVEVKTIEQNFRNIQLKELREHERNTIIQTWGIPPELFGIISSSNRSTIELAPFVFATYALLPRLERERDCYQYKLLPEYDAKLILDYESPVPEDKEFKAKIMTAQPTMFKKNEFRELADMPELDEFGDDIAEPAAAPPPGAVPPPASESDAHKWFRKFNEHHAPPGSPEGGEFISGDGGSGDGGSGGHREPVASSPHAFKPEYGPISYASMGSSTVKIRADGQITVSKPKSVDEALAQLDTMRAIMRAASDDAKAATPGTLVRQGTAMRESHAMRQLTRAMGSAQKIVTAFRRGKGTEDAIMQKLEALLRRVAEEFGVEPSDPDEPEDEFVYLSPDAQKMQRVVDDLTDEDVAHLAASIDKLLAR